MDVRDFIGIRHLFRWGGVDGEDCTTWCARYAQLLTGEDPAEQFRGTYNTREGARRLIASRGGLPAFVGPILAEQGWKRVQRPSSGDLAVIRTLAGFEGEEPVVTEVSALRFGPLWSVFGPLGPVGISETKAEIAACWRWAE